jgi:pyruvate formate lyase activating enzyme
MWLRYVLVPGLTDIPEEMEAVADFAASLGVVERVEILPFHQLGQYKWEARLDYKLSDRAADARGRRQGHFDFPGAGLDAAD